MDRRPRRDRRASWLWSDDDRGQHAHLDGPDLGSRVDSLAVKDEDEAEARIHQDAEPADVLDPFLASHLRDINAEAEAFSAGKTRLHPYVERDLHPRR